ncbi:MAG TPA: SurA N-terminal domain-containing protein [Kofleriaceae bacterium]|nr:SurA N-terminal domain-containing protein [Kofleriaceae bacterium]
MLEQTRRQASIFVYLIFGLLIVIFIYGINPGNRGGSEGGCGISTNTVVTVDGNSAKQTAYHIAYQANGGRGRQKVYLALDNIIMRELLAQAAEARGIRTDDDLVRSAIGRGEFFLGGRRDDARGQYFQSSGNPGSEPHFSYNAWKAWVSQLSVSESSYIEEQGRGMEAALMADLISSSVRVSHDEALASYLYDHDTVTYDLVAFDPGKYRRAMHLTDADTRRYLDSHSAEVEARYKADERTYKAVKPQLALREIFIPKATPEAAKPDDKAAKPDDKKPADKTAKPDGKAAKPDGKKPADKTAKTDDKKPVDKTAKTDDKKPAAGAAKPYGLPTDVAKAKLEAIRAEIAAGKLAFPDAEKQVAADASDDAPTDNGDRGWLSIDQIAIGDKAVNDAVKALKPGEMTPVIVTGQGVYLVMATGKREGDLSFDQVKTEIAAALAKDAWSKEAAKRAALDALAKIHASGKGLDTMFEREQPAAPPPGGMDQMLQLLQDPSLSPEEKQKLLEMLQQQKHGSLEVHEEDVPVAWYADADGSGSGPGSAAPAPAAGSAPAPAPAAGSAPAPAPAAGSAPAPAPAAGSGAPAGAGTPAGGSAPGSGAGSAAAAASSPPAPAPEIVASNDQLPQLDPVDKPKISHIGPVPREGTMPGVGASKAAITALFDELTPGSVAKKLYEGDSGAYVVVQVVNRTRPEVAEFDKTAGTEIARMRKARGVAALFGWLRTRCETLAKSGRILPAAELIRESNDQGQPTKTVYRACMYLDAFERDALERAAYER